MEIILQNVFTLPMRNWNLLEAKLTQEEAERFLLYLWGIETAPGDTMLWKGKLVFTLPMRNWNKIQEYWPAQKQNVFTLPMRNWNKAIVVLEGIHPGVFTLPMRNWNCFHDCLKESKKESFYFTYEELKLCSIFFQAVIYFSFLLYLWGIETTKPFMFFD